MTREIKFRIWDSDQGKVLPVITMSYDAEGRQRFGFQRAEAGLEPAQMEYCEADIHDPTVAVMQYTGLTDKNGREIYEGDIVAAGSITALVKWSDRVHGWVCRWERKRGHGTTIDYGEPGLGWREHEVIGSIYENPELLA